MYPPFFMLPLGLIIFPYFINLILNVKNYKSIFVYFISGFFYGFGFLLIYISWIKNPFLVNENTTPYVFLSILFPFFLSFFFAIIFLLYKYFNNTFNIVIITPFLFLIIEFVISNFLYGFPWISSSLILSNNIFGLFLIKYYGTLGSGFLIISFFLLPSIYFYKFKKYQLLKLFCTFYLPSILILIFAFYFNFLNNKNVTDKEMSIDIHQLLIPLKNPNKEKIEKNIINIIKNSNAEYLFFAENNFPYLIDDNYISQFTKLIKKEQKVIIGASRIKDNDYYNSFLLLEKNKYTYFDKQILVPFGEFLPFRPFLKFMESISGTVDFKIGEKDRILKTNNDLKILPVICYEIIFDETFKNINKKQIDIIVNITNDAWFGDKIGPYQHFYIVRTKSLIANRPILRISNNGISAVIDNNGNIIKYSKLNQKSNIKHELKLSKNNNFIYFHKLFFYFLIIFFILIVFSYLREKKLNEL